MYSCPQRRCERSIDANFATTADKKKVGNAACLFVYFYPCLAFRGQAIVALACRLSKSCRQAVDVRTKTYLSPVAGAKKKFLHGPDRLSRSVNFALSGLSEPISSRENRTSAAALLLRRHCTQTTA